jgi:hypothetical protein
MYAQDLFDQQQAPINRQELASRVLLIVNKQPGLKACEIARIIANQAHIDLKRRAVNQVLHSELVTKIRKSEDFRFYPAKMKVATKREMAQPIETPVAATVITHASSGNLHQPAQQVKLEPQINVQIIRTQAPKYYFAIAAVIIIALGVIVALLANQSPAEAKQPEAVATVLIIDSTVVRDTIVVTQIIDADPFDAGRIDRLQVDILRLQKDTLEIGRSIADMQAKFDAREFVGNRAELAYAQGRFQRVCRQLYAKQDSLQLLASH